MVHYSFAKATNNNNNNKLNDSFFLAWHAPIVIQNNNFSLSCVFKKHIQTHTHACTTASNGNKTLLGKIKKSYHFAVMKCHELRWRVRVIPNKEERMRVSKIAWEWVWTLAKKEKKEHFAKEDDKNRVSLQLFTLYIGHLVAKH